MIRTEEVLAIQSEVAAAFGETQGVRDLEALERALERPYAAPNGIPAHPTFLNKVAALFQALLEAKPFAGANRRTAVATVILLLEEKGYALRSAPGELNTLITSIELGFTTPHRITVWLKGHTVRRAWRAGQPSPEGAPRR